MTLTVVTIAKEPLPLLRRFVTWHLSQGADRIILFLDDPDDPARTALAGEPRLDLIPCTPETWRKMGAKPDARFTRRQRAALTTGYHTASEGWVLILDADELMWFPGQTLADATARFSPAIASVRVASAEQVFLQDGGEALRLPISRQAVNEIYGQDAELFRPRLGLVGHAEGKSFHRAGLDGARFKMHWGHDAEGNRLPEHLLCPADGAHLVHYAAPDYDTWRAKVGWRTGSWGFAEPVKQTLLAAFDAPDAEARFRALYDRLYTLDADTVRHLEDRGGLRRDGPPLPRL
ncbi:hypothetical protein roselon_02050 [Roseibacterium elongatum DSM 19469]|uniref:Glycosyl transferase family 2 n=1 Tax=Roseicyclus elongatus DSM 19469 TaxID=1294273 RepID=W8S6D5_9RHOB|nr:glycosyltransferase family 2 protein [Roseibacterium elongatum]AHM04401.1 hypothetical protein roselon_02050 [Roseibacterium elongatum DSM 19469]